MHRREVLWLFGSTLLARAAEPAGGGVAGTPEKRAAYLRVMLEALVTEIGPRPAGSKGDAAGARVIQRELERALGAASLDPFPFQGWEPVGEAEFEVAGQKLETYLAENSEGTPAEGVQGNLHKGQTSGYEIASGDARRVLARIGISEFGRAIASLQRGEDAVPLFNIGKQDTGVLDRAVQQGLPVRAKGLAKWIPGATTSNVAATLEGESDEEILFVAHMDTKYNTPGANDNTASVIAMLMLAHAMSGSRPYRTVSFVATTVEERGYLGAKHYAQARKAKGTLGDIKVCINLDSLTYGPNLQIATTDSGLEKTILAVHRDLGIRSQPRVLQQDDTMDSAPFKAAGARTVHLNSRGDDARTLPLWHRPEDRADTIKPEFVENSFLVLMEVCARLARRDTVL